MLRYPAAWMPCMHGRDDAEAVALATRWLRLQQERRGGPSPVVVDQTLSLRDDPLLAQFRHAQHTRQGQQDDLLLFGAPVLVYAPDPAVLADAIRGAGLTGGPICVVEGPDHEVRWWASSVGAIDLSRPDNPRLTEAITFLCNGCSVQQARALVVDLQQRKLLHYEDVRARLHAAGMPHEKIETIARIIRDLPWQRFPNA